MVPEPFVAKDDEMGRQLERAWSQQQLIGWDNMVKGRLSVHWATIQESYYRSHPDIRHMQTFTGFGWATGVIKALTTMLLEMWANRCGCLHGHTRQQKRDKERDMIGRTVRQCYRQRGTV